LWCGVVRYRLSEHYVSVCFHRGKYQVDVREHTTNSYTPTNKQQHTHTHTQTYTQHKKTPNECMMLKYFFFCLWQKKWKVEIRWTCSILFWWFLAFSLLLKCAFFFCFSCDHYMLCEFFLFDALMVDPVEPTAAETLLGWRKNNTQIEKKTLPKPQQRN